MDDAATELEVSPAEPRRPHVVVLPPLRVDGVGLPGEASPTAVLPLHLFEAGAACE